MISITSCRGTSSLRSGLLALLALLAAVASAPAQPAASTPAVGGLGWTPEGLVPEVANRPPLGCTTVEPAGPVDRGHWNSNIWTDGLVPFEFDSNTDGTMQAAAVAAMNTVAGVCGVRFRARAGEANFIHFRNSSGNNSPVGRGANTINIFNWNFRFIICHEIMHSLGVWHEQSRNDRNTFVMINLANVCQNCCSGGSCNHNFDQAGGIDVGPYDFDSVMHYDGNAFSINGMPTIVVLPPNQALQGAIGQRDHLSAGDIAGLLSRYPLSACCSSAGGCTITAQADCAGTWLRDVAACSAGACLGACCSQSGACSMTLQPACTGASIFRGAGVACAADSCLGACCSPSGACTFVSSTTCASAGGIFRGTDVPCAPSTCPGACCSQAGACTFVPALACRAADGTFRGTDIPCQPLTCPGACCSGNGACEFTSASICAADNRSFRGLDRPCDPFECPGACCLRNRSCIITGFGNCAVQRGEYLGLDTTCTNNPCCCRPWDNGYADGRGGQQSQLGLHDDWHPLLNTAWDDFFLCEGQVHLIDHASAVVATNAELPKFIVVIAPDCNGRPVFDRPLAVAGLAGTVFDVPQSDVPFVLGRVQIEDIDPPDADGYRPVTVDAIFDAKRLALHGGVYWVSFIGLSGGADPLDEFFWQTSGHLVVKGRPGVYYDGDSVRTSDELCCGCTDYNFCIEGESCKILLDNGPPAVAGGDPLGLPSLQNGTSTATRSRAADKLVFPPCEAFTPCYIEGWVFTNCDHVALQLFPDGCRCPLDSSPGSSLREADCVTSTGLTFNDATGVPVTLKKAQFLFDDTHTFASLLGQPSGVRGRNLWLSLVGLGENRQNARAYFAFADPCSTDCTNFGPACYRPAPFDTTRWQTAAPPADHDLALLVAVREAERVVLPVVDPAPRCAADINRDGAASVQDIFDYLAAWFAGCP